MLIIRAMKTVDAIALFSDKPAEGIVKLATALNITRAAIYQWGEDVPALRAYQIRDYLAANPAEARQAA